MEKPARYMPAKAPVMATGTTRVGISVARRFCRNSRMTRKTSTTASIRVLTTSWMEMRHELGAVVGR